MSSKIKSAPPPREIADRLAELREESGKNQKDYAASLKIADRTYQSYERAESWPGAPFLQSLAKIGINVNWVLTGIGPKRLERPSRTDALLHPTLKGEMLVATDGPGFNTVRDKDGTLRERVDLVPEVMAPSLKWVATEAKADFDADSWIRAAGAMIARYEFEFFTWLRAGRPAKWPRE